MSVVGDSSRCEGVSTALTPTKQQQQAADMHEFLARCCLFPIQVCFVVMAL